jgi:uncharacterized protein Yka (UPF0111/DUF47 family)
MFGRLFRSKDYGFYELFERHAAATLEGAGALADLLKQFDRMSEHALRLEEIEHRCDTYTHMTVDLLHKCFITPLDRDEIVRLITGLDDTIDLIQATAKRLQLFEVRSIPETMRKMGDVLLRAVAKVEQMVKMIRAMRESEKIRQLGEEIHQLENEGDRLFTLGVSETLKSYAAEPLMVIKLKEIYEIMEAAIDHAEDVSNTVEGIFLEHA